MPKHLLRLPKWLKAGWSVQLINFSIFAGIATLVDIGSLYVLTSYVGLMYIISSGISYVAGTVTSFTLNKQMNFKGSGNGIVSQFSIYAGIAFIGLVFNQAIIFTLVEYFALWYIIAKSFSAVIVGVLSFLAHKKYTFRTS